MKKILAVALSLVLVLAMVCTACAEVRSFELTMILDTEGNELPDEEMPEAIITIDDDETTMACAYETAEGVEEGTYEIVEEDAETQIVTMNLYFPEETILVGYDAENNCCYMSDDIGQTYVYTYVAAE